MRFIYLLIAVSILVLDQIAKWAVVTRFSSDTTVTVIPGLFSLVRVENRGIAFGILGKMSSSVAFALIVAVSLAALGVISYLLWKCSPSARQAGIALSLLLGGAAGNLVDRVARGSVVDYLDFYFRDYHWYTFNIADSAIVVGAGLLALDLLWGRPAKLGAGCCSSEP
jgi:signal peptidase II